MPACTWPLAWAGGLRSGVALGQMLNVSKNGFSYSHVQGELAYAVGRVLLSARASIMPYNTAIPYVESIARRDAGRVSAGCKHHFIKGVNLGDWGMAVENKIVGNREAVMLRLRSA